MANKIKEALQLLVQELLFSYRKKKVSAWLHLVKNAYFVLNSAPFIAKPAILTLLLDIRLALRSFMS